MMRWFKLVCIVILVSISIADGGLSSRFTRILSKKLTSIWNGGFRWPKNRPLKLINQTVCGFRGWMMHCVDSPRNTSIVMVIGTFDNLDDTNGTIKNYVFIGVNTPDGLFTRRSFPTSNLVTISKDEGDASTVKWAASGIGEFFLNSTHCSASLDIEGLNFKMNCSDFELWAPINEHEASPDYESNWCSILSKPLVELRLFFGKLLIGKGPEGWLNIVASCFPKLLPCRYYVHCLQAKSQYEINVSEDNKSDQTHSEVDNNSNNPSYNTKVQSLYRKYLRSKEYMRGNGGLTRKRAYSCSNYATTHIESNSGAAFPTGWIWLHGVCDGNPFENELVGNNVHCSDNAISPAKYSILVVGGRFVVGGIPSTQVIVSLRKDQQTSIPVLSEQLFGCDASLRKVNNHYVFRSIDFDSFAYEFNGVTGVVDLNASSWKHDYSCRITARPRPYGTGSISNESGSCEQQKNRTLSTVLRNFGAPLYVPTINGFSNDPGCREHYDGTIVVTLERRKKSICNPLKYFVRKPQLLISGIHKLWNRMRLTRRQSVFPAGYESRDSTGLTIDNCSSGENEILASAPRTDDKTITFPSAIIEFGGCFQGHVRRSSTII